MQEHPWRTGAVIAAATTVYGFSSGYLLWNPNTNRPLYDDRKIAESSQQAQERINQIKKQVTGGTMPTGIVQSQSLPEADAASVDRAGAALKASSTKVHCPTPQQPNYRVTFAGEEKDPSAVVCLRTDNLRVIDAAGSKTIVMAMSTSEQYSQNNVDFLANSFAGLNAEQCAARTGLLEAYGGYLAVTVGGIPSTNSTPIGVVATHDRLSNCDTWPKRGISERSDRVK